MMVSRERFQGVLDQLVSDTSIWRNLISIVAILSMLLPWVYLDGSGSPLSGADLIEYTFFGPERGAMARESFLGAASLLVVPLVVLVMAVTVFAKTVRGHTSIAWNAAAGLLPLLIVIFAGRVTSSDHLLVGGFVIPGWGMILLFLCQVSLLAHSLLQHD